MASASLIRSILPSTNIPPPVHIEQIIADRKTYDATSDAKRAIAACPR